jgi:hypothetical protein
MATPSPASAVPPRRRFHFRLVPTLFFRPRRAFTEIVALERPSWLTPLLILSVAALLPVLAAGRVRQQAAAIGEQPLPPDFQYYSPGQQAQFMQALESTRSPTFLYVLPGVAAVAVVWIGWLITGGVLHLASTILGGRSTSLSVLTVAAWAGLPFALRAVIRAGFIFSAGRTIAGPGLAGFVSGDVAGAALFARQALATLDLYLVWHLLLLGLGLASLGGLSTMKIVASVAVTEVVALLVQAVPAALSASLAGQTIVRPFLF